MKLGLPSRRRNQCCPGGGTEVANLTQGDLQPRVSSPRQERGADLLPEASPPLKCQGIRV